MDLQRTLTLAKGALLDPEPTWRGYLPEAGDWQHTAALLTAPLIVASTIAAYLLGFLGSGVSLFGQFRPTLGSSLLGIVSGAVAIGVVAFIVSFFAGVFGGRKSFALSLAATIYLLTGFRYNDQTKSYSPLSLLSGLAPPTQYNVFLADPKTDVDPVIQARFPSYTKCANNLDCFKVYEEGVQYAKEVNKPILLDFTGYGCVNCRKTEENIWIVDKVWKQIQDDYVLISLYTDDRKKLETPLISVRDGSKLRTTGSLWQEFQIVNFEQNSQPLYVLITPDEKVMAAPRGYNSDVNKYSLFLECGLEVFKDNYSQLGMEK